MISVTQMILTAGRVTKVHPVNKKAARELNLFVLQSTQTDRIEERRKQRDKFESVFRIEGISTHKRLVGD